MNRTSAKEWRVELASRVLRQLERMAPQARNRMLRALNLLSHGPYQRMIRKLHGRPEWRLRIGSRRALFLVDSPARTITVVDIDTRSSIYMWD